AYVHSQSNSSVVSLIVPVEIKNLPSTKMILLPSTRQAQVTVKGPSFLVRDLAVSALTFRVNMPANVSNQYTVQLNEKSLPIPSTISVLNIEPSEIDLILDDVTESELPIVTPRIGKLEDGYSLTGQSSIPSRALVRGPKTEVQTLKRIESDPVDFRELTETSTFVLKLRPPGKYTQVLQDSVQHTVQISAKTTERRFKEIAVQAEGLDKNMFKISPAVVQVEVSGAKRVLKELSAQDITAKVDGDGNASVGKKLKVQVVVPDKAQLVMVDPETVSVVKK
ncbi:MAG: YbbR-like domain-containing protein, partial [Bdellovibrionales bacterium]|nr:YbbR-like domain-containing protein [Bdellovibrionales bacterium]